MQGNSDACERPIPTKTSPEGERLIAGVRTEEAHGGGPEHACERAGCVCCQRPPRRQPRPEEEAKVPQLLRNMECCSARPLFTGWACVTNARSLEENKRVMHLRQLMKDEGGGGGCGAGPGEEGGCEGHAVGEVVEAVGDEVHGRPLESAGGGQTMPWGGTSSGAVCLLHERHFLVASRRRWCRVYIAAPHLRLLRPAPSEWTAFSSAANPSTPPATASPRRLSGPRGPSRPSALARLYACGSPWRKASPAVCGWSVAVVSQKQVSVCTQQAHVAL